MTSLHGYVKATEYEVILRTRCSLWCQNSFPWQVSIYQDVIVPIHTERHIQKQCHDHQVDVKWLPSPPQSADFEHHASLMGRPGVQREKWISTSFIPQSFPSSMKGKHPITYSPEPVRQHSMRD